MSKRLPPELMNLLDADEPSNARRAWERFVRTHSSLLLEATRSLDGDYDSSMNRYAYVLEKLQDDDFRRLRAYRADKRAKFSTWLVVVAKRLCIDHHRSQYGRHSAEEELAESDGSMLVRRRLVELIGHCDVDELPDSKELDAESRLVKEEVMTALEQAVGALEGRDQLLLSLRFEDGETAREIRRLMGFPSPKHVYRRLERILTRLREALEEGGIR